MSGRKDRDFDTEVDMFRSIFDDPKPLTGNRVIDGQSLNAGVAARLAAHGRLIGGLREHLIALLRSDCEIAPFVRQELANALERGAGEEATDTPGSEGWKLKIVGLGKNKSQGERTRTRRKWGKIGEFIHGEIAKKSRARGARESALKAAQSKFHVSREAAEKAHKYFKKREKWVAEKERIIREQYVDDFHEVMALKASRQEYDQLHARNARSPAQQLQALRQHYTAD